MYIDAHAHLEMYDDAQLVDVLDSIERDQTLALSVSVDSRSFGRTEEIASTSKFVVPCFGVHPSEAHRYIDRLDVLEDLALRSPMFGEVGLDYRMVTDETLYPAQRKVFSWFVERAAAQNKILSVHCVGAEQDTLALLLREPSVRAIIHWYSGPLDILDLMIDAGFMFSVGVEVLHSDHVTRVAEAVPPGQLLTETDNPGGWRWLTDDAGQPALIRDVSDRLSEIRGVAQTELVATVTENMARLIARDNHLDRWANLLR